MKSCYGCQCKTPTIFSDVQYCIGDVTAADLPPPDIAAHSLTEEPHGEIKGGKLQMISCCDVEIEQYFKFDMTVISAVLHHF